VTCEHSFDLTEGQTMAVLRDVRTSWIKKFCVMTAAAAMLGAAGTAAT